MQVRIKEIMVEKGVSSVSLADTIGVSKVTVSNLINNKTMPSVETLEKIASAYVATLRLASRSNR